jgi:hypothetical protein
MPLKRREDDDAESVNSSHSSLKISTTKRSRQSLNKTSNSVVDQLRNQHVIYLNVLKLNEKKIVNFDYILIELN